VQPLSHRLTFTFWSMPGHCAIIGGGVVAGCRASLNLACATRKHRAALEAINSGKAPAFAAGGFARRNAFSSSSTYAPSAAINMGQHGEPETGRPVRPASRIRRGCRPSASGWLQAHGRPEARPACQQPFTGPGEATPKLLGGRQGSAYGTSSKMAEENIDDLIRIVSSEGIQSPRIQAIMQGPPTRARLALVQVLGRGTAGGGRLAAQNTPY
jgi:hypothetical protein